MADATFQHFLESGKSLLTTTMQPRKADVKSVKKEKGPTTAVQSPVSDDPHKVFVRKCVGEKPKKAEVVEMMRRFIDSAEADL
jgi:hypothetical protein